MASALINPSAFGGPDADDPLTRVVVVAVVVIVVVDALLLEDDPYVNLNAPSFDEGVAADDAPATVVAALRDARAVIIGVDFVVDTPPQMTRAAYLRPSHRLFPSPPIPDDTRVDACVDEIDDVNRVLVEHTDDVTPWLAPTSVIDVD